MAERGEFLALLMLCQAMMAKLLDAGVLDARDLLEEIDKVLLDLEGRGGDQDAVRAREALEPIVRALGVRLSKDGH